MKRFAVSRLVFAALLCLALAGCKEWMVARGPVPKAAVDAASRGNRGKIRVELNSGEVVAMSDAGVRSDSVVGVLPAARRGESPTAAGHALTDVRRVEYERRNYMAPLGFGVRLIALGFGLLLAFFLLIVLTYDGP